MEGRGKIASIRGGMLFRGGYRGRMGMPMRGRGMPPRMRGRGGPMMMRGGPHRGGFGPPRGMFRPMVRGMPPRLMLRPVPMLRMVRPQSDSVQIPRLQAPARLPPPSRHPPPSRPPPPANTPLPNRLQSPARMPPTHSGPSPLMRVVTGQRPPLRGFGMRGPRPVIRVLMPSRPHAPLGGHPQKRLMPSGPHGFQKRPRLENPTFNNGYQRPHPPPSQSNYSHNDPNVQEGYQQSNFGGNGYPGGQYANDYSGQDGYQPSQGPSPYGDPSSYEVHSPNNGQRYSNPQPQNYDNQYENYSYDSYGNDNYQNDSYEGGYSGQGYQHSNADYGKYPTY